MIIRTYVVKMPTEVSTTPLDILVEANPGLQDAPVVAGSDGAYYEWRGLPLVLPNPASDSSFVPRFRLGFEVAVTPVAAAISPAVPGVQLSQSLVGGLASTDVGPTIPVTAFPDPVAGAAIRLIGGIDTAGLVFLVAVRVNEARDEDLNPTGR